MDIGKKLKELRESQGLTQKQLGEKIGVTAATITRYEQNKREPKYEILSKICDVLNVGMFEFIIDESTFDKVVLKKLRETTSAKELLETAFLQNPYFSHKMEICTSSIKEQNEFFNMFGEYIESYLKTQELLTMPWLEDDDSNK